jgi:hypothetical protein
MIRSNKKQQNDRRNSFACGCIAKSGCAIGRTVRILDLALQMIRLAGLKPAEDIEIVFTGLRPGEKLFEELFHFSENAVFDGLQLGHAQDTI